MSTIVQDLRYALRQLKKSPGFALTAVLTLALGIGATTAMLAVVDSVLWRPLNFPHSERLMKVATSDTKAQGVAATWSVYEQLARNLHGQMELAAYSDLPQPVRTPDGTEMLLAPEVSTNFFATLGVKPAMGRDFAQGDDAMGAGKAILSRTFWLQKMHGDAAVLGKTLQVGGALYTIVGVLPARFEFPVQNHNGVYTTFQLSKGKTWQGFSYFDLLGRLRPGLSLPTAQAAGALAVSRLTKDPNFPGNTPPKRLLLTPYLATVTGEQRTPLLTLLAACGILLLIACVNTANLQIARATTRQPEMAVRSALGASRGRIVQQSLIESVLLALVGGGTGLLLAELLCTTARRTLGEHLPRFDSLSVSPAVFLGCFAITAICGVGCGILPALRLSRERLSLGQSSSGTARVSRRHRLSGLLITGELALTCLLLVAGGLLLRTFQALEHVPLGFEPEHLTSMTLIPEQSDSAPASQVATYDALLAWIEHMPGVQSAGMMTSLPFSDFQMSMFGDFQFVGRKNNSGQDAGITATTPDAFRAMGVQLLAGRFLDEADRAGAPQVALVNRRFAQRFFGSKSPVGKQINFDQGPDAAGKPNPLRITIVGEVSNSMQGRDLGAEIAPMIFVSTHQLPSGGNTAHYMVGIAAAFAIRSTLQQDALAPMLRAAVKSEAPGFAIDEIAPVEQEVQATLQQRRLALRLATGFGLLALLLAAVGIHGVLAYLVAQRVREIGIRMALGSSRAAVLWLVFREVLRMSALGLTLGMVGALLAGRGLRSFLFGVSSQDPLTLVAVALLVLGISLVAALLPARRAANVDPVEALRAE